MKLARSLRKFFNKLAEKVIGVSTTYDSSYFHPRASDIEQKILFREACVNPELHKYITPVVHKRHKNRLIGVYVAPEDREVYEQTKLRLQRERNYIY
jgi:hypothetical protein